MPGGKRIMSHLDVSSPHLQGDDDSPGLGRKPGRVDMERKQCWTTHEPLGTASVAGLRAGVSEPSIHMHSHGIVLCSDVRVIFQYLCPIKIY